MSISIKSVGGVTTAAIASENESFDVLPTGEEDAIGDKESLRRAFANPLYKTSESFRQTVADCIARSSVIASPGADAGRPSNQLNGRYQVRGNPIDEAPTAERELTDHDKAMIALAERHGL